MGGGYKEKKLHFAKFANNIQLMKNANTLEEGEKTFKMISNMPKLLG